MRDIQIWKTSVSNVQETNDLATHIGTLLHGGEVIELVSDLGGGKTTFVKGLAKGFGSLDVARSPSFTLSNQYVSGKKTMYHFDFYRLSEAGIMQDELVEVLHDPLAVVVIEWAGIVEGVLPAARVQIAIEATTENGRDFTFQYPQAYDYLFPVRHN